MNRGFYKAVDRVVRDIMKNESEPPSTNSDKFYLYFKTLHARRRKMRALRVQICEKIYVKFVLPKICANEPPQIQGALPI
ncbi:hypothetical protein PHMEG_00041317 [Phytophthora megakarya]|uniref:Uncharacterized protein n=1 Tax=Phytophthora megakarya TaxID=4795 RepID=A0A225UBP1_9STRA|nr:hypothetical protein PHMEG_00041317 [Phytophthora megakarya]